VNGLGARLSRDPARAYAVGAVLRMPNESLVELCGMVGMDFVLLDCEHGPADGDALLHHVTASEAAGLTCLVRTSGTDPVEILRLLDLGVSGIVVPHVSTPAQARSAVAAAHYPPLGARGLAVYTRAGRYGLASVESHLEAAGRTVVVVMIEDMAGVDSAAAILGTQGVDGVLVGPSDLALSARTAGLGPAAAIEAQSSVEEQARGLDRAVVRIVSDEAGASAAVDDGCQVVLLNLQALLTRRLADVADSVLRR